MRITQELLKHGFLHAGLMTITREGDRFKVYLPMKLNPLWEELQGVKVEVWLRIKSG